MKKTILSAILLLSLSACASAYTDLGYSWIHDATEPVLVTNQKGSKRGEACGENILGIYAYGDYSIDAAKRNGRITTVASVDSKVNNILGFYAKRCTIVRGY